MNIEPQSGLGVSASNLNHRAIENDFTHSDAGWHFTPACLLHFGSDRGHLYQKSSRRNARQISGPEQKIQIVALYFQFLDGHDRRRLRGTTEPPERDSLGNTARMRKIGRTKVLERDGGGKRFLQ